MSSARRPHGLGLRVRVLSLVVSALILGAATGRASEDELRIAKDFMSAQRYADALRSLGNVLRDSPDSVEGNYLTGIVYLENKNPTKARGYLLKALQGDPTHREAAKQVVPLLRAEARSGGERARTVLEFPIRKHSIFLPPLVDDLFRLYAAQNEKSQILKVADLFAQKLDQGAVADGFSKEAGDALVLAARVAVSGGNMAKASEMIERARSQNSSAEGLSELTTQIRDDLLRRAQPLKEEGDRLALGGSFAEALASYRRALDAYPSWPEVKSAILTVSSLQEAEKLMAEAEDLEKKGYDAPALAKIALAQAKVPDDRLFQNRIEGLKLRLEERKTAIEAKEAEKRKKDREVRANFAAAFDRAEASASGGQWQEAVKFYEEALSFFPGDGMVSEKLAAAKAKASIQTAFQEGVSAFQKKRFAAALQSFLEVQQKDPTIPQLKRYLASAYFEQKKFEEARAAASAELERSPGNKEMLYILGVIHHDRVVANLERPGTAIGYFEKMDDPGYQDVEERLADLKWRQNRIPILGAAIALVLWVGALFWTKKRPQILKNAFLAKVEKYAAKERWSELSKLEGESRRYPLDRIQDLAVTTALMQAFYHLKDWPRAINWGLQALNLARENPNLILLMGRIYFEGQIISQEVLRYLIPLANQEPENIELLKFIGEFCLEKQVLNDDTMPILRNLALAMPQHDKLRRMLIRGYLRTQDKSARAMALYRVELEKDPTNVDLLYMIAQDALKANRVEEAIQLSERILNERLNHVPTHQVLRDAYRRLGKTDQLARIYQGILENDPYNPAVQESLKKLLDPELERGAAATPEAGAEGPKNCAQCGHAVQVGQYYCVCGAPI